MNRLHPWPFAFAAAATFSVLYTACALAGLYDLFAPASPEPKARA